MWGTGVLMPATQKAELAKITTTVNGVTFASEDPANGVILWNQP